MAITPTDLTPSEALLLLEPGRQRGKESVKLSLMWLLARRLLTTEQRQRRILGITSSATWLRVAPPSIAQRPPQEMAALLGLVRSCGGEMSVLAKTATREFGAGLAGFVSRYARPSLIRRGLLAERRERLLWIFPVTRLVRSPAGDALAARIRGMLDQARAIPGYLDSNPLQAAALAASLGGLIFLLPELQPHMGRIGAAVRQRDTTGSGGSSGSDSGSTGSDTGRRNDEAVGEPGNLDMGGLDMGALDLGGIDLAAFETSLQSLDTSFDSAMSGGGSDGSGGGGGDGGGGGGGGGGD